MLHNYSVESIQQSNERLLLLLLTNWTTRQKVGIVPHSKKPLLLTFKCPLDLAVIWTEGWAKGQLKDVSCIWNFKSFAGEKSNIFGVKDQTTSMYSEGYSWLCWVW